jgi:hypothetical protein
MRTLSSTVASSAAIDDFGRDAEADGANATSRRAAADRKTSPCAGRIDDGLVMGIYSYVD